MKKTLKQQLIEKQRMDVYKATPTKLKLVDKLVSAIKHCFPNVETNIIRFDDSHLKLGDLTVQMVELDPQKFGKVLVHWYPRKDISTQNDPFCSAYMLAEEEINILIKEMKRIKKYYVSHQNKK
jgi:hypothetical protein